MGLSSSTYNFSSHRPVDQQPTVPRITDVAEMDLLAVREEDPIYFQVAILGKHGSGKSKLIARYSLDNYTEQGHRTVLTYSILRQVKIEDNSMIPLQIWDNIQYCKRRPETYVCRLKGCILVYNVSDRNSFEIVDDYIDKLQEHADCHVCKVLVALQCDYPVDEWAVSREEGEELARKLRVPYLEASAKNNINIAEIFLTLANHIHQSPSDAPGALGPQLLSAVKKANLGEIDRLVSAGADVNYAERGQGCTPILLATFTRDLRLVRYLLEHGACADGDMEYGQHYKKPLHWACRRYMLDIAEELLRHGADINSLDQRDRSPLFYADDGDRNKLMEIAGDYVGLK